MFYNYFRDYDPATGRHVQSDPIGLQGGLNTYGYVGGNALGAIDPEGLACRVVFYALGWQVQACDRQPPATSGGWQSDGENRHPDKQEQNEALNCPKDSNDCSELIWAIDVLTRQTKFYRANSQDLQRQGKMGGVEDHRKFYTRTLQVELKALIARAKIKGCIYNPEADIEANRPFTHPTRYD